MRLAKVFLNPNSDEPTLGLRGLACLAIGCASPLYLDWIEMGFPLLVAMIGGVGFGVIMLGKAWENSGI